MRVSLLLCLPHNAQAGSFFVTLGGGSGAPTWAVLCLLHHCSALKHEHPSLSYRISLSLTGDTMDLCWRCQCFARSSGERGLRQWAISVHLIHTVKPGSWHKRPETEKWDSSGDSQMTFRPWWSLWCNCCSFWDEFISQVSIRCSQARWGYGNIFYPFPWRVVLLRVIVNWQPLPLSNVSIFLACLVLVLLMVSQISISGTVFTSQLLSVSFLWFLHFSCRVPRVEHLLCCPWFKNSEKIFWVISSINAFPLRGVWIL